jgi:hypothetical protein
MRVCVCVCVCVCACARTCRCFLFCFLLLLLLLLLLVLCCYSGRYVRRLSRAPCAAFGCLRASVLWLAHYTDAGLILSCMRQFPDVHVGSLV